MSNENFFKLLNLPFEVLVLKMKKFHKNGCDFILGMSDLMKDEPVEVFLNKKSGLLFSGSMGVGKSVGIRSTLLHSYLVEGDRCHYIILDTFRVASEYSAFSNIPNIEFSLGPQSAYSTINRLYEEMIARKNMADTDYTKIIVTIESWEFFMKEIRYVSEWNLSNTYASKLSELIKEGGKYKINFLTAIQKSTISDLPLDLRPSFIVVGFFGDSINPLSRQLIRGDKKCVIDQRVMKFDYEKIENLGNILKDVQYDDFFIKNLTF